MMVTFLQASAQASFTLVSSWVCCCPAFPACDQQDSGDAGVGKLGWGVGVLGSLSGAKPLRTRTYLFPDEKVFPRSIKTQGLKIHQRFHFASALKRMSVLASYEKLGSTDLCYIAAVKGAPETLHSMVSQPQPQG